MEQLIQKSILLEIIDRTELLDIPPKTIQQSNLIMKLSNLSKTKIHPITYFEKKVLKNQKYSNHLSIFSDGRKDVEKLVVL